MPEGDTIFRSARSLKQWIGGRTVTATTDSRRKPIGIERVIGESILDVQPHAKHLLMPFSNGLVLHTHMRMTGSWHVYKSGDPWKKPAWQAVVVLECGDHLAACFNAPVVELLTADEAESHMSISGLGPDVLGEGRFDFDEVKRRAAKADPKTPIGELLLDQRVVSGIGNIYRCETLFINRVDPWLPAPEVSEDLLDRLVRTAIEMMRRSVMPGGGRAKRHVYKCPGRPCGRCGTLVKAGRIGRVHVRDVYWCPKCQAPGSAGVEDASVTA